MAEGNILCKTENSLQIIYLQKTWDIAHELFKKTIMVHLECFSII